nr:penicillin-binding transpeptidase domain-containing protein [Paenibacillus larvae]
MLKKIRMRSLIIGGFFTLFFLVLIGRLFYVQVIQADWLTAKAAGQWNSTETLAANRGMIMDRNDKTLAEDTLAYSIAVNPRDIKKLDVLDEVVSGLTKILGSENGNNENLEKKIRETATKEKPKDENAQAANSSTDTKSTAGENYDYLLAQVELRPEGMQLDSVKAKQVQDLIASIKQHLTERDSKTYPKNKVQKESVGITVMESTKRFYPNKSLAAHIIGYINREGTPQMGLEQQEDEILKGIPGKLNLQTDLKGVEAPGNSQKILQEPVDGKNIRLTIDNNIQFYVEDALSEAYKKYKPKSLSAIVADVNTMEILGMASYPNFNPNEFYKTDGKKGEFVNNAIQSVYEPGSTFKAVTLAASIQENLFKPSDYYHSGSIKIGDTLIKDHNNGAGWGTLPI